MSERTKPEIRLATITAKLAADLPPIEVGDPDRVRSLIAQHVRPDWQRTARFFWGVATDEDRALLDWDDAELWDEGDECCHDHPR